MKRRIVAMILASGVAAPVCAQETLAGDYARALAGCAATDYALSISENQIAFPSFSCVGASMALQDARDGRRVFRVEAPLCYSARSNNPTARVFMIVVEGDRLQIAPEGGAGGEQLVRCEKSERP